MKKFTIASFMALTLLVNGLKAQDVTMKMSELSPYFDAYLEPFAGAMAVGMSGGWTTTAATHSMLGFDVTFSASIVNVPDASRTFNANSVPMEGFTFSGGNLDNVPTISAKGDVVSPQLSKEIVIPGYGSSSFLFDGLKGLGINKGGGAALQASVGLPKGTDLMVRFVPDFSGAVNNMIPDGTDIGLSKTGMWGLGVKHDIKQWIPVVKAVPFLQMSAMLTYSKFNTGFSGGDLKFDPERLGATSSLPAATWDNQSFDFEMSSFTGGLLVGASIPIFQPFIGLGFNTAKFNGGFTGDFPVLTMSTDILDPNVGQVVVNETEKDPLNVDFKETMFNFQAGARVKLGFFVLHYTFTSQTYNMHTAGIGFTFR